MSEPTIALTAERDPRAETVVEDGALLLRDAGLPPVRCDPLSADGASPIFLSKAPG